MALYSLGSVHHGCLILSRWVVTWVTWYKHRPRSASTSPGVLQYTPGGSPRSRSPVVTEVQWPALTLYSAVMTLSSGTHPQPVTHVYDVPRYHILVTLVGMSPRPRWDYNKQRRRYHNVTWSVIIFNCIWSPYRLHIPLWNMINIYMAYEDKILNEVKHWRNLRSKCGTYHHICSVSCAAR